MMLPVAAGSVSIYRRHGLVSWHTVLPTLRFRPPQKAKKPKHGSLNATQAKCQWLTWKREKVDSGKLGIVAWQGGHERLWCPLLESRDVEGYSDQAQAHMTQTRLKKTLGEEGRR